MLKTKHKSTFLREFPGYTGDSFKHNTYLITVLYSLVEESRKKERKKARMKMNDSDFWLFQVCCFKMVTAAHCRYHYYCRLGQAL